MSESLIHIAPGFATLRGLLDGIDRHGVPPEAVLIYEARNKVYTLADPRIGTVLNIKAYRIPNIVNRVVYGLFRPGKAKRAFNNARKLLDLGIETARPIGYIEQGRRGWYGRSYFVSEQLPDEWKLLRDAEVRPDFESLNRALARFILGLHKLGIWMKDFSPGNILVRGGIDSGYTFAMIDINRMEFGISNRRKLYTNFQAIYSNSESVRRLATEYAVSAGYDDSQRERLERTAVRLFENKKKNRERKHRLKRWLGLKNQ